MVCVDVELFNKLQLYIGAALSVFTPSRPNDGDYFHSSLLPRHDAAIRDFRFGAELWFLGIVCTFSLL